MNRSLVALLITVSFFSACAKDKKDQKESPIARPSDAVVSGEAMLPPAVRPVPPKPVAEEPKPEENSENDEVKEDKEDQENKKEEPEIKADVDTDQTAKDPTPAEEEKEPATQPAPPSKPMPQPDLTPPSKEEPGMAGAQLLAREASITCKNNDCDPSVGMLSIVIKDAGGWGAVQCSASLIAPDILVTNAHCVPKDIAKAGASCQGRIWMNFGAQKGQPNLDRQVECAQVIYTHKEKNAADLSIFETPDYAYLKLVRPSNRPILRLSRGGFEHEKEYLLHKVNPIKTLGALRGEMEKVTCKALHDSAIFAQNLTKNSQVNFLSDCKVIPGNSGAPLISAEDGSIRGVIFAFVGKKEIRTLYSRNGARVPPVEQMADLNLGANFACLRSPGDFEGRNVPASCENYVQTVKAAKRAFELEKTAKLRVSARDLLAENAKGRADIAAFGWSLRLMLSPATGLVATGLPGCVVEKSVKAFLNREANLNRPLFYVTATYDQYMRASNYGLLWSGFSQVNEKMEIRRGGDLYQVVIKSPGSGQSDLKGTLGACGG